jgi:hypothetical protein
MAKTAVTWTMVFDKRAERNPVMSYRPDGKTPPATGPTWFQIWALLAAAGVADEAQAPRRIEVTITVPEE